VVANDDLDYTVIVRCFDVHCDRAGLACVHDRVVERLGSRDEDVENFAFADVLCCQPEPEMSAKSECLSWPSCQPQADPRMSIL
jgi:hypothetical protein